MTINKLLLCVAVSSLVSGCGSSDEPVIEDPVEEKVTSLAALHADGDNSATGVLLNYSSDTAEILNAEIYKDGSQLLVKSAGTTLSTSDALLTGAAASGLAQGARSSATAGIFGIPSSTDVFDTDVSAKAYLGTAQGTILDRTNTTLYEYSEGIAVVDINFKTSSLSATLSDFEVTNSSGSTASAPVEHIEILDLNLNGDVTKAFTDEISLFAQSGNALSDVSTSGAVGLFGTSEEGISSEIGGVVQFDNSDLDGSFVFLVH